MITFEQHNIEIRMNGWFETVPATIGVGTGLAYNKASDPRDTMGYTLTHVSSGYRLKPDITTTEKIAQRWLEKVATLVDWTGDEEAIRHEVINVQCGSFLQLGNAVEQALVEAQNEVHSVSQQES